MCGIWFVVIYIYSRFITSSVHSVGLCSGRNETVVIVISCH